MPDTPEPSPDLELGPSVATGGQRRQVHQEKSMVTQHGRRPFFPPPGPHRRSAPLPGALLCALLVTVLALSACGGRKKIELPPPVDGKLGWTEVGVASWYGHPYHGRMTSNGETYDMDRMTAAHTRLPFDTWLKVENLDNGRSVKVRINDRGPFAGGHIIDLSRAAASDLRMIGPGTARVRLTVIVAPDGNRGDSRRSPPSVKSGTGRARGGFEVQIGVFKSQANARTMAWEANRKGHRAEVRPFRRGRAKLHRVVVAGGTRKAANQRLRELKRQGFKGFVRLRRGD